MTEPSEALIFGDCTRELWQLFQQYASSTGVLIQPQIRKALNSINIYPTRSQVFEMVHCACECSGRTPVDHLTFGEFCILSTELHEAYRRNAPAPVPKSQLKEKAVLALEERRKKRRPSGNNPASFRVMGLQCLVFLGGSCNPTTWRHDVAIPYLKNHSITFYNPQVSNWKPELMEIEDQAKMTAELLFFVIDNQTRSTASMVEAAYLAGCGRQLVLVIKDFAPPVVVAEETLSPLEIEDLERSHAYLTDLVERQGIPVFSDMETALECTAKAIHQSVKVGDLTLSDGAMPVKFAHVRVADKLMKLKDVFNSVDTNNSGRLSKQDIRLAYRTIMDEEPPIDTFHTERETFTFEEFCCMVAENRCKRQSAMQRILCKLAKFPTRFYNWLHGYSNRQLSDSELRQRDIFLGGSCGSTTWREDIAIPMLRKQGISYFNPQLPEWSMRYIPLEAAVKDSCSLLLYVITPDTRGITSMLEASHFIGQGCNVVLCIQHMELGVEVDGERMSELAVKDYNRARAYLADLANRDGIPVFEKIEEAVECAMRRLRDSL